MQRIFSLLPLSRLWHFIKPAILPLLLAVYPSLFHYGNNVSIVTLPSLARALLLYLTLTLVIYAVFFIFVKKQVMKAANATFIFLIFFNLYGAVYHYLFNRDMVQVEHYRLLPLFVLIAIYASWFITKLNPGQFWKSAFYIMSALLILNLFKILPGELAKYKTANQAKQDTSSGESSFTKSEYPDIYFILFDELAGFDVMRNYWQYQGVDEFEQFLKSKGFFVAQDSRSSSIDTLQQMAERLNYQEYPTGAEYRDTYYEAIANNRVMSYLESLGYTTVVFDEKRFGYAAIPSMTADYSFEYDSSSVNKMNTGARYLFDDFGILVAENTMLQAFPIFYNKLIDPMFLKHQEMVYFTATEIANVDEIPSPKFVHVHLLLPHFPFMFSANGNVNDPLYFYNWNYYLGNYIFTLDLAQKMINTIFEDSDPAHPPIIILQSDHGARNSLVAARNGVQLEDFPEEYKTHIVNAIYLPGYDISKLPKDIKPINTFPLIFNHYFDMDIPLVK